MKNSGEPSSNKFIKVILPGNVDIAGVTINRRTIFYDPRGFLVETYSSMIEPEPSVYAYFSYTHPGEARDIDRFHFHQYQSDRFTVVMGKLWVVLLDMRLDSKSYHQLRVVEMTAADPTIREKKEVPLYTLTIPPGVYHGIRAPGQAPALLINHPTKVYDPNDEGRISFDKVDIPEIGKFSWDLVEK